MLRFPARSKFVFVTNETNEGHEGSRRSYGLCTGRVSLFVARTVRMEHARPLGEKSCWRKKEEDERRRSQNIPLLLLLCFEMLLFLVLIYGC